MELQGTLEPVDTAAPEFREVEAEVRLDDSQRQDVAIMPKGGHYDRGHSANALIRAVPTDLGLGAAYLDCFVRVAPKP